MFLMMAAPVGEEVEVSEQGTQELVQGMGVNVVGEIESLKVGASPLFVRALREERTNSSPNNRDGSFWLGSLADRSHRPVADRQLEGAQGHLRGHAGHAEIQVAVPATGRR